MRHVWRVQNAEGWGPYRGGDAEDLDLYSDWAHPCPCDDGPFMDKIEKRGIRLRDWLFGFESKEHALRWFGRETDTLNSRGYFLVQVKARAWCTGQKQLIFDPLIRSDYECFE